MASLADDSSVDENVSSVGGSTWDMVDEASAASEDDEDRETLHHQNQDDSIENLHLDAADFERSHRARSVERTNWNTSAWEIENIQNTELQEVRETTGAACRKPNLQPAVPTHQPSLGQTSLSDIMSEAGNDLKIMKATFASSGSLHSQHDLANDEEFSSVERIVMGVKAEGLVVSENFRFLFLGPREIKPLITQKIGSAIAANPRRMSLKDGLDSSRVTVVPVSALFDDSNPEVVMIESGGFDMNIEECTNAFQVMDEQHEIITMQLESDKTLESTWNFARDTYQVTNIEYMPDLAVLYQPASQSAQVDQTTYWTTRFLKRHGVPFYFIVADGETLNPSSPATIESELVPHREIEDWKGGQSVSKSQLPLDLSTFLALDAGQLHQNIVALKANAAAGRSNSVPMHHSDKTEASSAWSKHAYQRWQAVSAPALLRFVLPAMAIGLMLTLTMLASFFVSYHITSPSLHTFTPSQGNKVQQISLTTPAPIPSAITNTVARPSNVQPQPKLVVKGNHKRRTQENFKSKPKRDTVIQIIGGSNILIRPAVPMKPSQIVFEAKRNAEHVPTTLKSFDGEYYVFEIPYSEAFGLVEISIRSTGRQKFEAEMEIDLGSPWLKPRYWQHIAQSLSNQSLSKGSQILHKFQQSLVSASSEHPIIPRNMFEKVNTTAMAMLEKIQNIRTRHMSAVGKQLDTQQSRLKYLKRSATRLKRSAQKTSIRVAKLYGNLWQSVAKSRQGWSRTAQAAKEALESRQHQSIRVVQKKLLQTWWGIVGRPEALQG